MKGLRIFSCTFARKTPKQAITLAWMAQRTAGYPIGGSQLFARKVAERYTGLGGKVHYNRTVQCIITENNRAIGVQLTNGEVHYADLVVSACDGYATIYKLLEGKYIDPRLERYYKHSPVFSSLVFVALGVKKDLSQLPASYMFALDEPLRIDPQTQKEDLWLRIHHYDPTLAPEGCTLVSAILHTDNADYWIALRRDDPERYEAEKKHIGDAVAAALQQKLGAMEIEMMDVSTPATIVRYTNNWKGSFEGWLNTPEMGFSYLPCRISGLNNFYMCGQWVSTGGGLPGVMLSARHAAQVICHERNLPFRTEKAVQTRKK